MMRVLGLLCLFFSLNPLRAAEVLSHGTQPIYRVEKRDIQRGFALRNVVQWQALPCSVDNFVIRKKLVHFPSFRYKGQIKPGDNEQEGYYCFHLELAGKRQKNLLHMRIIRVFGSAELSINGRSVWRQSGERGRILEVLHQAETSHLAMQISLACGESHLCGFRGAFKLNTVAKGLADELRIQTLDLFAFAGILLCGLFHLVFVSMGRRSGAALAILFVAIALASRIGLAGQGQLLLFTGIQESWFWRVELGSIYLLFPSAIAMIRGLFPQDVRAIWMQSATLVALLSVVWIPWAGPEHYLYFLFSAYLIIILAFFVLFRTCFMAYRRRRSGVPLFWLGAFIMLGSTVMEVTNTRFNIELNPSLHAFGYFCTIVIMAVLLAKRISEAFQRVESQEQEIKILAAELRGANEGLDRKIAERTSELASLITTLPTGILNVTKHDAGHWIVSSHYSGFLRETFGFDVKSFADLERIMHLVATEVPQSPFQTAELETVLTDTEGELSDRMARIRQLFPEKLHYQKGPRRLEFRLRLSFVQHLGELVGFFVFLVDVSALQALQEQSHTAERAREEALARLVAQADRMSDQEILEFLEHPFWQQLGPQRFEEFRKRIAQESHTWPLRRSS